ncbi:MAG: hypothetical protein ACFB13_06715 [Kiloniellaceae bacterium]
MNVSRASGRTGTAAALAGAFLLAGSLVGVLPAAAQNAAEPAGPISLFPPTVTAPGAAGSSAAPAPGDSPGGSRNDGDGTGQFGDIQVDRLGELDPESLGILDLDHGGLGVDAWAGSDRLATEALLRDLPTDLASPTLRGIVTRLLLSSVRAPAAAANSAQPTMADAIAAAQETDFLRLRAERLYDLGELAGLNRLLGLVPQRVEDPWLARARVDGLLLAGRDGEACAQVPAGLARYPQELYWAKAQVFCQFAADQTDQALLGLDLLREQAPDSDPAFFAAANLFLGASAGSLNGGDLTPLTLAMLRKAGGSLPADAAERASPLLLHGIAGLAGGDHAVQAGAVERLVEIGALPGGRLAGAYAAFEFTDQELGDALAEAERASQSEGGGVRGRALLYRAANRESLTATRAEILRAAFLSAEADGRATAMARAALPLMTELAPTSDLAWFAPLAARTLYRAGQFERAGAWLSVLRVDGLRNPESQADYLALSPLLRLAGGPEPLAVSLPAGGALSGPQRLLLFVLSRALGQDEDLAVAESAETPQPLVRLPRLLALGDTAVAGRRGDTVLLTVSALGAAAPVDSHPLALGYAVSALNAIGLGTDARALAIEAALAAGI